MFRVDHKARTGGTYRVGEILLPPAFMMKRFGKYAQADGYKVSGQWAFVSKAGKVFTVYEWESTTLYSGRGSDAPSVREFWSSWEPESLHIGGRGVTGWEGFRDWLQEAYQGYRPRWFNPAWRTTSVVNMA